MEEMIPEKPLGGKWLAKSIPPSFSSFYLTLISMIQGVALGLLGTVIGNLLTPKPLCYIPLFYALLTLSFLVVVWHEYVLAAQEFWWRISWADSALPFLIGIGEFLMIFFLGNAQDYAKWFMASGFATSAGVLAYLNYFIWIRKENFDGADAEAHKIFKWGVGIGLFVLVLFSVWNFVSGENVSSGGTPRLVGLGVVHGVFLMGLCISRHIWQRRALKHYGLKQFGRKEVRIPKKYGDQDD